MLKILLFRYPQRLDLFETNVTYNFVTYLRQTLNRIRSRKTKFLFGKSFKKIRGRKAAGNIDLEIFKINAHCKLSFKNHI